MENVVRQERMRRGAQSAGAQEGRNESRGERRQAGGHGGSQALPREQANNLNYVNAKRTRQST